MEENKEELNENVYIGGNAEEIDNNTEIDSELESVLDSTKIVKYANDILPKINDLILEYQENGEKISLDEFIVAISTLVPQVLLETEETSYSLLDVNHIINELLFNLK